MDSAGKGVQSTGAIAHTLVRIDQPIGAAVVAGRERLIAQLRQNCLSKLLAQFNPHLIEAIYVPDYALRKDLVFV